MHEIDKTNLSDQTKFRLYEIRKIENCFINDINQQKEYSKKLNKYVTIFDYIDKISIVLRNINYFIYNCYWYTSWYSKCKFYFNLFYKNRNH